MNYRIEIRDNVESGLGSAREPSRGWKSTGKGIIIVSKGMTVKKYLENFG